MSAFLSLFPERHQTFVRSRSSKVWRSTSQWHYLTDAEIATAISSPSSLYRAFGPQDKTSFVVIQFHEQSVHNLKNVHKLLMQSGVKAKPYYIKELNVWQLFIFFSTPIASKTATSTIKNWLSNNQYSSEAEVEVLPNGNPLCIPLQAEFTWLNQDYDPILSASEISLENCASMFLRDLADNSNTLDSLNQLQSGEEQSEQPAYAIQKYPEKPVVEVDQGIFHPSIQTKETKRSEIKVIEIAEMPAQLRSNNDPQQEDIAVENIVVTAVQEQLTDPPTMTEAVDQVAYSTISKSAAFEPLTEIEIGETDELPVKLESHEGRAPLDTGIANSIGYAVKDEMSETETSFPIEPVEQVAYSKTSEPETPEFDTRIEIAETVEVSVKLEAGDESAQLNIDEVNLVEPDVHDDVLKSSVLFESDDKAAYSNASESATAADYEYSSTSSIEISKTASFDHSESYGAQIPQENASSVGEAAEYPASSNQSFDLGPKKGPSKTRSRHSNTRDGPAQKQKNKPTICSDLNSYTQLTLPFGSNTS